MNKTKTLYVLLDSGQDVVETFPENSNYDYMFQLKQSVCPYGTLHKATLTILSEEKERIQQNSEVTAKENSMSANDNFCFYCGISFKNQPIKEYQSDSVYKVFCTNYCFDDFRQETYGPEY